MYPAHRPYRRPARAPGFASLPSWRATAAAALLTCAVSPLAWGATFTANFADDPGGTALGIAEIEEGVLKLTDLADLPPADPPKSLPQNGSYILPDFNGGAAIQAFTASFKAAVGGGSSLGAQGFSFILASEIGSDVFREGGGNTRGLVISFDTIDNLAGFNAEGNEPGDAPGIIVKIAGAKVAAKSFRGIQTYPANSTTTRFANVEVKLDTDGTLDVTYDGVKVYDNVGIGYTPIAGQFGFGAGTAELTAAIRNNHWIDDVNITTTNVGGGAYVSAKSPAAQGVRADATVSIVVENLASSTVSMTFDGAAVTPNVTSQGNTRTVTYDPPGLLASGSKHAVVLTYDTSKTFAFEFDVASYVTIPASAKAKAGSVNTSSSGFKARPYQVASPAPSGVATAERQLAGLSGPNIADLSAGTGGLFNIETVNWDDDQAGAGSFTTDDAIVGYPGTTTDGNSAQDNLVIEAVAFVELTAGVNTLGVQSDDGFKVTIGGDPRDVTAPVVGSFEGVANNTFSFVVEEAGIYGLRLLWYEIGGDANCELFSLNAAGERILVNDRATAGHIKAYRDRTGAVAPFVSSVKPAPGETGVNPKLSVQVDITEDSTVINASSVVLKIKDITVTPTVTKSGKVTTVSYVHAGEVPADTYPVSLSYADASGNSAISSWSFSTAPGSCENIAGPAVTGYWSFDDGTLKATVGADMSYIDSSIASFYAFGTSGQGAFTDVPGINGKPVKFLSIPRNENGEDFRKTGLRTKPGLPANGGGANANVWTMIMDVYWGDGHGNGTVLRTHDLNQNNDGDLFWAAGDGTYGKGCCSPYVGATPAGRHDRHTWGRVVIVADLTTTPKRFAKYINGVKHREDVTGDGANIDGRFSLPSDIFMFNDGDDNEQSSLFVSAVQFRDGALSDADIAELGGPSADGIPVPDSGGGSGVASQWEFNGSLQASTGNAATYIDPALASHYTFGTSGQGAYADIPGINGQPVQFLAIPRNENGEDFRKTGLRVSPGLAASGGGANANVWTMVMDVYWGDGHGNGTVLRTHDLNQNNDGDLFWAAGDGSYGKGCCSPYVGATPAGRHERHAWGRVVFVADLTANPKRFAKYINGVKHREDVTGDGANIDGRFSLPSEIFMFNDGDDNEQSTVLVNSVQFRPVALTDTEVAALGGPSAAGIPAPETVSPSIKAHWDFAGNLTATVGSDLTYIDAALASHYSFGTSGQGAFADVPGINGQSVQFLAIPRNENGEDFRKTGLRARTGLGASGGGANANVWTMIMDAYWGDGHGNGTVLRTHDLNQNNDGDLFWAAGDGSYGKGCCSPYVGATPAGRHERHAWGRVVFVADLTASPKRFAKYVNGVKHREDVTGDGANIDGRFSLPSEIFLFNDGDDNEQSTVYVSAVQFREGALTDDEVAALGGPTVDGPPLTGTSAGACVPLGGSTVAVELHAASAVTGPYSLSSAATVNTAAKTITVPRSGNAAFYRVRGATAVTIKSVAIQGANLVIGYE
ncbi:MAG: hypothetical protein IT580_21345 [Verrucomicrobiales bacterium]|nr:hypothetical protein [Verrucomicrobiales bacterium]